MAVDTQDNVLAAGYTENTGTGADFTVVKFSPEGTLLWRQALNGTANSIDGASSMAVDTDGDVLAAGATRNIGTAFDLTVAKFAARDDSPWNFCAPEGGVCAFTDMTRCAMGLTGRMSTGRSLMALRVLTPCSAIPSSAHGSPARSPSRRPRLSGPSARRKVVCARASRQTRISTCL